MLTIEYRYRSELTIDGRRAPAHNNRMHQRTLIHSAVVSILVFVLFGGFEVHVVSAQPSSRTAAYPRQDAPVLQFTHLTINDGLSVSGISSVLQDRLGFMWIGTQDGLNRYDGHRVDVFRPIPFDTTSLIDPVIYALAEDSRGGLWISTLTALVRRDPQTGHFRSYRYDSNSPHAPSGRSRSLLTTSDGAVWAGTMSHGLDRLDIATGTFTRLRHSPADTASLSSDGITALHRSTDGTIWVGTINGLNRLRVLSDDSPAKAYASTRFLVDPTRQAGDYSVSSLLNSVPAPTSIRSSVVTAICEDRSEPHVLWVATQKGLVRFNTRDGASRTFLPNSNPTAAPVFVSLVADPHESGVFWAATMSNGLYRFDATAERFHYFQHDEADPSSLMGDALVQLYTDRSGLIWIVGFFSGVDRFNPAGLPFQHEHHKRNNANSLVENTVWGFAEDHDGQLWISTQGGLDRFDPRDGTYTHFRHDPNDSRTPSSAAGFGVLVDSKGILWLGTTSTGIDRIDKNGRRIDNFSHEEGDSSGLTPGAVFTIKEDRAGTIWAATSRGLNRFDAEKQRFRRVPLDADPEKEFVVFDILEDYSGVLWIGTQEGLRRLEPSTGAVSAYRYNPQNRSGLSSDVILTIHEREHEPGVLWLGTAESGLNRFDTRSGEAVHYNESNGLPNPCIYGILEDDRGHLWLSTNNGISDFDPERATVVNYGPSDGLQSREFNQSAYFRSERTGEMYFGGINGYNRFQPAGFQRNVYPPDVVLTGMKLFHKSVLVKPNGILDVPLWEEQEVQLKALHRSLTFEFIALHYQNPSKNRTSYRLEGFDEDWIDAGEENAATYTNLAPGRYTFRVRAANSDDVWTESGAAISVVVLPPWYQSGWAYGTCILLLLGGLYGIRVADRRRLRASEEARVELEERVRQRTSELEAANRELESFSYSVSHDLRAPLRAIEGFSRILVDDYSERLDDQASNYLERVRSNVLRMRTLIDDLLEFSRATRREPKRERVSPAGIIRQVIAELEPTYENRSIDLKVEDAPECLADPALLRQVYTNLLSNSVKYTRDRKRAKIHVGGERIGHLVRYHVADNGVGFDMQYSDNLFGVFQRLHSGEEFEGTGVGLAIVQRIIHRHGGEVWAEAEPNVGATFFFTLPAHGENAAVN